MLRSSHRVARRRQYRGRGWRSCARNDAPNPVHAHGRLGEASGNDLGARDVDLDRDFVDSAELNPVGAIPGAVRKARDV